MDKFPKTFAFLIFTSFIFFSSSSNAERCTSQRFSNGRGFANCSDLPVLNSFLHWNYHESNHTVDIAYRHTKMSMSSSSWRWVAWAINPNGTGMLGAQALVALVAPNGSVRAYTSPVTAYTTRLQDAPLSFPVITESAEFLNNEIIIYATIELPQGSSTFNHVWQHGSAMRHETEGDHMRSSGTVDFAATGSNVGGGSRRRQRNVHGVLNVVSWGILMPLGAMTARYLKVFESGNPAWRYLHVTCQSLAYIIGVAGWAIGMKLGNDSAGVKQTTHRNIGIALFALATLQVVALRLRPTYEGRWKIFWNLFHHVVGYAVIALSIANIFKGFDILDPEKKWKNAYIGVIIFLGAAAVLLEAFTWFVVIITKEASVRIPKNNGVDTNPQEWASCFDFMSFMLPYLV